MDREPQIDVWVIGLEQPDEIVERGRRLLRDDEIPRADRFVFEKHRRSFALSRAALRMILGRRMNRDPHDIEFDYGPKGKPALHGGDVPRFNLSHSGEMAVVAVTDDCDVGIDVEFARRLRDLEGMARRVFSPTERKWFRSTTPEDQAALFYDIWTAKEAVVKGFGEGIGYPFHALTVPLDCLSSPVRARHDDGTSSEWHLRRIDVESPYQCFLASRDVPGRVRVRPFSFAREDCGIDL